MGLRSLDKLKRGPQSVVAAMDQGRGIRGTEDACAGLRQLPPGAGEVRIAPKPKIDDLDRETGKPQFANYGEYELAKDDWLQQDTIRQIREMLNLVMGTQEAQ